MSVSKWRYTEQCNGRPCPGDCDHCSFEPGDLINRADAIEAVKETMKNCVDNEPLSDSDDFKDYIIRLAKLTSISADIVKSLTALPSADAEVSDYAKWLEDIIVKAETLEWLCEDTKVLRNYLHNGKRR